MCQLYMERLCNGVSVVSAFFIAQHTSRRIDQHKDSTLSLLLWNQIPGSKKARTDLIVPPGVWNTFGVRRWRVQSCHLLPERLCLYLLSVIDQVCLIVDGRSPVCYGLCLRCHTVSRSMSCGMPDQVRLGTSPATLRDVEAISEWKCRARTLSKRVLERLFRTSIKTIERKLCGGCRS